MSGTEYGKKGVGSRILSGIEFVGNKLPDPITLFVILSAVVIVISGICSAAGVSAVHPGTGETITVTNLFSVSGIKYIWSNFITNFSTFAPFGMAMIAVVGSGAAEKSGFLAALMRKLLSSAPPALVTFTIIFISINGNHAGDAAFVVMPPLAALAFMGIGRHPLFGIFTAFAAVSAGFCSNLMVGLSDALAYGFTEAAAQLIDPGYVASPAINWYFLVVSCIILSIIGTLVAEKIVAPRFADVDLGKYDFDAQNERLTPEQNKGLNYAIIAFAVTLIVIVFMSLGSSPILGDAESGSIMASTSPFMQGIVLTLSILLFVPGAVFGFVSGQYKNDRDLFAGVTDAFKDMAPYVLLCIFCSQFTNFFGKSNLGAIMAIKGAEKLAAFQLPPILLLIGLIFVSCIVNIFIGSASAKWAILAPVFVPMMMLMNFDPAVTQIAYRIGDSITNPLSPLFSYFPLVLGFARRYEKNIGMGTIIANMIPFSATFAVAWIIQLTVWVLLDLPLGPGGGIFLS